MSTLKQLNRRCYKHFRDFVGYLADLEVTLDLTTICPLDPYRALQEAFKNSDSAGKSAAGAKILRFRTQKHNFLRGKRAVGAIFFSFGT